VGGRDKTSVRIKARQLALGKSRTLCFFFRKSADAMIPTLTTSLQTEITMPNDNFALEVHQTVAGPK
jgi:hypothetical protein